MPSGKISTYIEKKGFGFIKSEEHAGKDLFFHVSACRDFTPAVGMAVTFEIDRGGDKGPEAKSVKAVGQKTHTPPEPLTPKASSKVKLQVNAILIPAATACVATPAISKSSNPALLLDRFPQTIEIEEQKNQREHLQRVVAANHLVAAEEYQRTLQRLEGGINPMLLRSKSRIAIHLSRAAGLENANCCLYPVHGFAYLPGSGLKGLAHAYACHIFRCKNEASRLQKEGVAVGGGETGPWNNNDAKEKFIRCVEDIFGWTPNAERQGESSDWLPRSNRIKKRENEQQRGLIAFHDAFGETDDHKPPRLEIDIATPHYGDYYRDPKNNPPGDWMNPNPVSFLTIAAGTRFRFRVTKAESACSDALLNAAKRLLLGGLHWLGAGAKTASGYGWFEEAWTISEQEKAAQKANALEDARAQLADDEFLWQRPMEGGGATSGHRIEFDDSGQPIHGEKVKLNKQIGAQPGQYVVVKNNPSGGAKAIPIRIVE